MTIKKIITWLELHWKAVILGIVVLYLATHIFALTKLPVFADEAIYIRWTQLMIEDFSRYAFFPLNDGKTPLQMWLMIPLVRVMADPLVAGRFLSVIAGLAQIFILKEMIKTAGGGKLAQLIGMLGVVIFPFWFFQHRMALIDGLLTLWLSIAVLGLLKLVELFKNLSFKTTIKNEPVRLIAVWTAITGVAFGLALLTKLPALFFSPVFVLSIFLNFDRKKNWLPQLAPRVIVVGLTGIIGLAMFFSLKLHPAFGQLFGRGNDFTFTTAELLSGEWINSIKNIGRVFVWHGYYMSFGLSALVFALPLNRKRWPIHLFLLLSCFASIAPYVIFGRVLAPRYVFPMVIFTTTIGALLAEEYLQSKKKIANLVAGVVLVGAVFNGLRFMGTNYVHPNRLAFPPVDRMQYLEEWSSGHGILETLSLVQSLANDQRVWVMTEGYFGTLPDALLMYLYGQNVENLEIEGIGAPVHDLPDHFYEKYSSFDKVLLVVNSHRFKVPDTYAINGQPVQFVLVDSFERPNDAPSLQVYEVMIQE